ncbi:MAG: helicase SNF2 [Bacteroidetes bacterium 43-93]|nr:SNF2 helicase associated domain-containing protein [Bacteroidota bacterium]OJW99581.1 MAG: helicase SNF2 [Bacteroidetes bacterium 43-93]
MSLPPVLKHVYNHGTEEVIRRGKKIFYTGGVQMLDVDHLLEQVRFRVRNDVYQNYYTVTVNKFLDTRNLSVRCQCPYNMGDICRHEVAALFQLNDILQSGFFENANITYDQKHSVVRMRQVTMQMLRVFASSDIIDKATMWAASKKAIIVKGKNDRIEAEVPDGEQTYKVVLKQNEDRYFDTSCGCDEKEFPLCIHKATLFIQILNAHGPQYFQTVRDWDEQKNKLLALYGYSLNDDLTNKFEFTYKDGKPFLRVLDPTIQKVQRPLDVATPVKQQAAQVVNTITKEPAPKEEDIKRLGIVLDPYGNLYPNVNVMLVAGQTDEDGTKFINGIDILELGQYVNPLQFKDNERELLPIARKFMPDETLRYLKKNLPFGDFIDDIEVMFKEHPTEEVTEQIWEYLLPKYQKLLERYKDHGLCFIKGQGKRLSSKDIEPVAFSTTKVAPQLSVTKREGSYHIELSWIVNEKYVPFKNVLQLNAGLLMHDYTVYALANVAQVKIAERLLPDGELEISAEEWPAFLNDTVMQWSQLMHINFGDEIVEHIEKTAPVNRLYLQEKEQVLVLQPAFSYGGIEIKWGFFGDVIEPKDGIIKVIRRDEVAEQAYIQMLRTLHSDIQQNGREHFFYMPATAVLANNWFFRFAEVMKEWNVELFGYDELKTLRVSTYKPDTRISVSSGIDWFDATVEIVFGDQKVSLIDVKKALSQKQNFVKLGDGSVGLLPEDWIKKYALLIKMGENKGGSIRLKKYHFSVLDELLAEVDEEELQKELEEKKERLVDIIENDYSNIKPPAQLQATLRPYQQAGFQWLLFLKEAGWGGILADDMGLGKTVQALTLFQHYKNEHPDAKFLVICPTTLMYNWENEIKKFTPELTHFIHHGPKRMASLRSFEPFDVIITTYGTMRSDIKVFKEISFDYVVLDESQSIKNPQSQVAKASLLLNSKHRLALSGTPVQNNTFDLFAQMNFLNPGILGSREFFMNEFATPIDKFQEDEVKQQLRKITYPFLLRRTKEQVAKDLPEKTEMILYCEMGDEQRKIYDAYRNVYREQIMGMIEERGVERSTMHILQGLTRLRQICDSPAILNEAERFHNYSIKLDELTREITENVGNHKALIFSQFLGMLDLIRKELEARGIPYVYFDGSTSATDREKAIKEFQGNESCRVFLISLKAGGIGLNLTAADYVYIVDPWWNPAVEQQAIDRTHRIGQTKNIFAYRLICKDTIEEKMLTLQERKRALANELVSDDNAFLKRLTKEDIAYLLS